MNIYLVTNNGYWDNIYIVKANNKKEAINKLFEHNFKWRNERMKSEKSGYKLYTKSDFEAVRLQEKFDENGIAYLN